MLDKLRRNPDAVALAILCLLLGVARFSSADGPVAARLPVGVGLHRVWNGPSPVLENLRQKLEDLRSRAEAPPCLNF